MKKKQAGRQINEAKRRRAASQQVGRNKNANAEFKKKSLFCQSFGEYNKEIMRDMFRILKIIRFLKKFKLYIQMNRLPTTF